MSKEHVSPWTSEACATTCPFFLECDRFEAELITPLTEIAVNRLAEADLDGGSDAAVEQEPLLTTEGERHIVLTDQKNDLREAIEENFTRRLAWERHNAGASCSTGAPRVSKKTGELICNSRLGKRDLKNSIESVIYFPKSGRDIPRH